MNIEHLIHQMTFRFFDLDVIIYSDDSEILDWFTDMYPRFTVSEIDEKNEGSVVFTVLTQSSNTYGSPAIICENDVNLIEDPKYFQGYIYEYVYYTILNKIRSHYLFHAGSISFNNQGIILAADSMHGKTTCVLKLIEKGFFYLSDEIAAICRSDKLLYPFPRSLRIRQDTLNRVGFSDAVDKAKLWSDKLLLDIEDIRQGSLGSNVPLKWVIIFSSPFDSFTLQRDQSVRDLHLFLDRVNGEFLTAIQEFAILIDERTNPQDTCTRISLRTRSDQNILSKVEELCSREGLVLYYATKKLEKPTSFEYPARLEMIPHTQAVIELIRGFMGGNQSSILKLDYQANVKGMFLEIASLLEEAKCYRLYVGPLDQMVDLISSLVGADSND